MKFNKHISRNTASAIILNQNKKGFPPEPPWLVWWFERIMLIIRITRPAAGCGPSRLVTHALKWHKLEESWTVNYVFYFEKCQLKSLGKKLNKFLQRYLLMLRRWNVPLEQNRASRTPLWNVIINFIHESSPKIVLSNQLAASVVDIDKETRQWCWIQKGIKNLQILTKFSSAKAHTCERWRCFDIAICYYQLRQKSLTILNKFVKWWTKWLINQHSQTMSINSFSETILKCQMWHL